MGAPLLIGAGVGALGSAVMGGNPLKGALLGGATGGLAGGASSLLGGGSFLEGAGLSGLGATAPVSTAAIPTAADIGAGFGYTASGASPFAVGEVAGIPTAADVGAGFGASEIEQMAMQDPTLWEKLKPYVTPSNVIGVANVASQFQPKPYQMSGGGGGGIVRSQFTPHNSQLSTGDLLLRKKSNPFLLG